MQFINYFIVSRPSTYTKLLSVPLAFLGPRHSSHDRRAESVTMKLSPRVLSIQSHVVAGYVGNKSATFPLQVLGIDVDAINTVQFSNHSGYGYCKGNSLTEEDLGDLAEGLSHNGLDVCYTHILTGYNRSKTFLLRVAKLIAELRLKNPGLMYYCDPVIGDYPRGVYVPKDLLEVYRDTVIPLADVISPNQFETELLTGADVKSISAAWVAIEALHNLGPRIVVISSFELNEDDHLYCLGSKKTGEKSERFTISFPKLQGSFTGTGDLFSALLLAWMWRTEQNLKESMELTIATIQAVLVRTCEGGAKNLPIELELKLIQSKLDIEKPKVTIFAQHG